MQDRGPIALLKDHNGIFSNVQKSHNSVSKTSCGYRSLGLEEERAVSLKWNFDTRL
jgi:hypothetical protein